MSRLHFASLLEYWSDGEMEYWNDGIMECWNIGMLKYRLYRKISLT